VRMAKPKAIQKMLQRKGVGTRLTYTAEDLIEAAKKSIATISPAKELILQGKVRTLLHLRERYEELVHRSVAIRGSGHNHLFRTIGR